MPEQPSYNLAFVPPALGGQPPAASDAARPPEPTHPRCRPRLCPLLAVVLLASGLTACRPKAGAGAGGAPMGMMAFQVRTAEARRQPVTESLSLVSDIAANEAVELKSETDGIVQDIQFEEGQDVTNGQLLLRLDDTKLAATLAEVEANFKLSETTFARTKQLFQDKLISQQEYDQAGANFDRTRASVDLMKRQLKDARILAPFAGVVGARSVSPGQVITRNTVLTTLVDIDPVKVEFYVPERFLGQVHLGQIIEIGVTAFPERRFQGKVYFIAAQLDLETRKALVKALIPNTDRALKPGMFGTLELTLKLRNSAIVIPEIALMYDGDDARVFVVQTAGTNQVAMIRPVKVGLRLPGQAEIVAGLEPGEKVVTEGTQKIVPGMPVRESAPPELAAAPTPTAGETNATPKAADPKPAAP